MGAWLHRLSFRLWPGTCVLCGDPSQRDLDLCAGCEGDLPLLDAQCARCALPLAPAADGAICGQCSREPPAFSAALIPYRYAAPLDLLIHRFKHRGDLAAGRVLGHLLARHLGTALGEPPDVIAPVPLHWRRSTVRGFNQAVELGCGLAHALDLPWNPRLLARCQASPPQQQLGRSARRRNLRGAFVVQHKVVGLSVALVDDVMTTGATAHGIATCLRQAGAAGVQIWALARTPLAK